MGLLDEAIREHLELKRRRGADVSEIARQEREAFGAGTAVAEPDDDLALDHAPALDEPGEFAAAEPRPLRAAPEPVDEHPELHHEPALREDPPPHKEPTRLHHHEAELETEPPRPHGDPADEFPHASEPVRDEPAPPEHAGQPTREFDLDEVRAATGAEPEVVPADEDPDADAEADDVLEETPEFLQETPEHDRLWFEQRPPRDFNF